jgi:acetyl-CoA synthetase
MLLFQSHKYFFQFQFAGFSSDSLAERMSDCKAKVLITADGAWRGEKLLNLKKICDEALDKADTVKSCIVVSHMARVTPGKENYNENVEVPWNDERDHWWHDEMEDAEPACYPEWMDAEDPLFLLYTSGSTGKPKGVLHTTAGYLLYAATTFKLVFDYKPGDIYWCTADIGWITGHSYVVYGPLANGATSVMFEGTPFFPDNDRVCSQLGMVYVCNCFLKCKNLDEWFFC